MQTPQRGSVLLTIIGGIIILAMFGMAAVSLMTGSVMAGLDAKETVQASYLAESGKEIVRVQAAKADTGAKLMALADNALDGKTFSIAGGDISLKLFPSWFRTSEAGTLLTGGSGWYPEAPSGTRELLLIAKPGTASRAEYSFGEATALTPNADAYLIGRGTPTYPTQTQTAISVSTATNDFDYFPQNGGLIGVVDKGGATLNPDSAKRLTYERLSKSGSTYTFEGVRPVSGSSYPELGEGKELVLGQYIRVVSEAQTANGARAALVWHTNGRSSLRPASGSGGSGNGGVQEMPETSNPLQNEDDAEAIFGGNRLGRLGTVQGQKGLSVQGHERATPDHFLNTRKNHTTYDSWFAGITEEETAETPNNDILIQTSIMPYHHASANLFAGILFRTHLIPEPGGADGDGLTSYGVSSLGMGVVSGKMTTGYIQYPTAPGAYGSTDTGVTRSPVNPALLPGGYGAISPYQPNDSIHYRQPNVYIPDDPYGAYDYLYANAADRTLRDGILLWHADDGKPEHALTCLAYGIPAGEILKKDSTTTLVVRVWEQDNKNCIQGWIAFQDNNNVMEETYWPFLTDTQPSNDLPQGQRPAFRRVIWGYVNPALAIKIDDYTIATSQGIPVSGVHDHAGIFSGAYSSNPETPGGLVFRHFKTGIPGTGGSGTDDVPGLTPGIVQ